MYDFVTDPIGLQVSFGLKSRPTYTFKIKDFFFYIQLYGTPNYVEITS